MLELVIGMAVSMLLLSLATRLLIYQQQIFNEEAEITEMHQNLRFAMDIIVNDVKMAGYNLRIDSPFDGFQDTAVDNDGDGYPDKLKIWADLNGDGAAEATEPNERIVYTFLTGTNTIARQNIDSSNPYVLDDFIAENIVDLKFNYRDSAGAVTTTPDDIYQVWISITGRTATEDTRLKDASIDRYRYGTLTTYITPLNLKYNDDND